MSQEEGWSTGAAACRALGLARSSFYRPSRASVESQRVRKEVLELSAKHPRYGYRRITALLRREGFEVNAKRIARLRREEGLKVSKKQRRMKRLGVSTAERLKAEHPVIHPCKFAGTQILGHGICGDGYNQYVRIAGAR